MNNIEIPRHMRIPLAESGRWKWGEDFYFHYTASFAMNEKLEVEVRFTEASKEKKKLIEDLELDYMGVKQ